MTTATPDLGDPISVLRSLSARLAGGDGDEIRACIERLSELAGTTAAEDAALRERAAGELEHLVAAIGRFAGLGGSSADALRGIDIAPVVDQLRAVAGQL